MQIILSIFSGIFPTLIWLWFWLKEDSKNPEPKKYILITFIAGMVVALLAITVEKFILENSVRYSLISFFLLSATEEIFKFAGAYFVALKRKVLDEPIDAVIYMVTIALGFAAMENSLYFWSSLNENIITMANMRFIGATVLHTASSGIIGALIAFSFYKNKIIKKISLIIGLVLSILLHTGFNFFIISSNGKSILNVFVFVWLVVIILFLLAEKIKQLKFTPK